MFHHNNVFWLCAFLGVVIEHGLRGGIVQIDGCCTCSGLNGHVLSCHSVNVTESRTGRLPLSSSSYGQSSRAAAG